MRSSSIEPTGRFWASSMTSSTRRPSWAHCRQKASIRFSRVALSTSSNGIENAAATMRSVSSGASCVVTTLAATYFWLSSSENRWPTRVVLPIPMSPVMMMNPSPWLRP